MYSWLVCAAIHPMVEVAVLARATVRRLARVTASRATEATTRALTAAPAPTVREAIVATAILSQVEEAPTSAQIHSHRFPVNCESVSFSQVDTGLHPPTRVVVVVVGMVTQVSPTAPVAITAATSRPA